MPELKRTFTGGKMEKDLDERIVPNGDYREALNIGVATSEDSDVGAAQNILGNIKVSSAISSRTYSGTIFGNEHINGWNPNFTTLQNEQLKTSAGKEGFNYHITQTIDPQTDMLYRFIHTANPSEGIWMDRIVEYDTSKNLDDPWEEKESAIMIDIFKVRDIITDHDCMCPGSNKSMIKVSKNVNQLRWGMRVEGTEINPDVTIEHIDYNTGWITLSEAIWSGNPPNQIPPIPGVCTQCAHCGSSVTFYGDRNLEFGNVDGLHKITGVNVIDGMIFWTDNVSEPKKVNIERGKAGSDSKNFAGTIAQRGLEKIDDFNQHTILMVTQDNVLQRVDTTPKDESFCPPIGCMDDGNQPWSLYPGDPNATPPIPGTPAITFDPTALFHDQSMCCYFGGCTDDTIDSEGNYLYCNYDPDACIDDGSCCAKCGCTDPNACNYDPTHCHDDGSCVYGGCQDAEATNYDPNAECHDPNACIYKYSCAPSGYRDNDCDRLVPDTESLGTFGFTYSTYPSNTNNPYYDINFMVADGLEGNTYQNLGNNTVAFGGLGRASTVRGTTKMAGILKGAWLYGESGNKNLAIGSLAIQEQIPNVTWNDPGTPGSTDGECTYPIDLNDYTLGYNIDRSCKYIIIGGVWRNIDGKGYNDWNTSDKLGYDFDLTTGASSSTHPGPGYWPTSQHQYRDVNGIAYYPWEMFESFVCFGDCPNTYIGQALGSAGYQFGGNTYTDMVNWLRDNGYDGNGPSIGSQFGGNDPVPGQTHHLYEFYHGLGAYMGNMTASDFKTWVINGRPQTGPQPNGPNTSYNDQMWAGAWFGGNVNSGDPIYNYGSYPEVTISDDMATLWSKVTNNGIGWAVNGAGDLPILGEWIFGDNACGCDNWNLNPTCVVDPLGPYDDLNDCQNCATCGCNPNNISYNCVNGSCVQIAGFGGQYSTLAQCQAVCIPNIGAFITDLGGGGNIGTSTGTPPSTRNNDIPTTDNNMNNNMYT